MKSKADTFDNHKGRLFQIHSQLQSFCITQNGKTSSGKCSITTLISVSMLSAFPAPAWANTCGKRRQFPLFQQCLALPTPAPTREHGTHHSSFLCPEAEHPHGSSRFSLRVNSTNAAEPHLCGTTSQNQPAVGSGLFQTDLKPAPHLRCFVAAAPEPPRHRNKRFITLC